MKLLKRTSLSILTILFLACFSIQGIAQAGSHYDSIPEELIAAISGGTKRIWINQQFVCF